MSAKKLRFSPVGSMEEQSMKCIWMMSGNLSYKLCDRGYDCENCPLDQALHPCRADRSSELVEAIPGLTKKRKLLKANAASEPASETSIGTFRMASDVFYHPNHFWARVETGGRLRFGLDDFGQKLFGRFYSVRLPSVGSMMNPAVPCLRLAYSSGEVPMAVPFVGTISQVNDRLEQQPSLVNQEPYTQGWLAVVNPDGLAERLKDMYYGQEAKCWLPQEIAKLSQILVSSVEECRPNVGTTLQDGGTEIQDLTKTVRPDQHEQILKAFFGVWIIQ